MTKPQGIDNWKGGQLIQKSVRVRGTSRVIRQAKIFGTCPRPKRQTGPSTEFNLESITPIVMDTSFSPCLFGSSP